MLDTLASFSQRNAPCGKYSCSVSLSRVIIVISLLVYLKWYIAVQRTNEAHLLEFTICLHPTIVRCRLKFKSWKWADLFHCLSLSLSFSILQILHSTDLSHCKICNWKGEFCAHKQHQGKTNKQTNNSVVFLFRFCFCNEFNQTQQQNDKKDIAKNEEWNEEEKKEETNKTSIDHIIELHSLVMWCCAINGSTNKKSKFTNE